MSQILLLGEVIDVTVSHLRMYALSLRLRELLPVHFIEAITVNPFRLSEHPAWNAQADALAAHVWIHPLEAAFSAFC